MTQTAIRKSDSVALQILKPLADAVKRVHFPEKDADGNPSLIRFFLDTGRLPNVTDKLPESVETKSKPVYRTDDGQGLLFRL